MAIKFLKLKKNSMVYYSLPEVSNYNVKSKENLKQYQNISCEKLAKQLSELSNRREVVDIKSYVAEYTMLYKTVKNKDIKRVFSLAQRKKISESTNCFIDAIQHNYYKGNPAVNRMVTFVTLTLPENQKHTDKVLIQTLVDFIDHLKKVKNTKIVNKIDTGIILHDLKNYVWRAETTEAGNIHFHLLLDTYFNHVTLKRVWNNYLSKLGYSGGENAANIHKLNSIGDVGAYVTKYLAKEPLNDTFAGLLSSGQLCHADLANYDPDVKYRRPVLYQSWGCSRDVRNLKALTFSGPEIADFAELRSKCEPVELSQEIADFVKIYKGKIYDLVKTCGIKLKNRVANTLTRVYDFLYNFSDDVKNDLGEMAWLARQKFEPVKENFSVNVVPVDRSYNGFLFD